MTATAKPATSAPATSAPATPTSQDWTKPAATAIPKEGYFKLEQGTVRPDLSRRPRPATASPSSRRSSRARSKTIREYGNKIEKTIRGLPDGLAVLKLHYLRWVLFDIGKDTYFMYQGIFDTDFDKYTEDAVALFTKYGINTVFENLEGFPRTGRRTRRRSSSSSGTTTVRASWSTASTRT